MMVGPVLCGSHPALWGLWGVVAVSSVSTSHSGYCGVDADRHDQHHKNNTKNFGVAIYLLDRIFGSYDPCDDDVTDAGGDGNVVGERFSGVGAGKGRSVGSSIAPSEELRKTPPRRSQRLKVA